MKSTTESNPTAPAIIRTTPPAVRSARQAATSTRSITNTVNAQAGSDAERQQPRANATTKAEKLRHQPEHPRQKRHSARSCARKLNAELTATSRIRTSNARGDLSGSA